MAGAGAGGVLSLADRVVGLLGRAVLAQAPLHGGCLARVTRLTLADGTMIVAKEALEPASDLTLEAWMLQELRRRADLPVPEVLAACRDLLLMSWLPHLPSGGLDAAAQRHAAELVAALHAIAGPAFGEERDTAIGPLVQPNAWSERWLPFFRDRRLLHMAHLALAAGRLEASFLLRLERLAGRLDGYLTEPAAPSLLHGDLWGGNILSAGGWIAGFVDPAIYHGHAEIELAFATLFDSLGEPFFQHYRELRPLEPGFFELRRDLYNLYPLLVHVRLFGSSYLPPIDRTLRRLGC